MSDSWDERKKALEEDYFHRKEQEAIERMRRKRQDEQAYVNATQCPKCDGTLLEVTYEDVQIDRCDKCNGIWLDAGELERLTQREEDPGWFGRLIRSVLGK